MASRIGKYKISKRDSALSILGNTDEYAVKGSVTFSNATLKLTGLTSGNSVVSTSLATKQLFITSSHYVTSSQTHKFSVAGTVNDAATEGGGLFDIVCLTK